MRKAFVFLLMLCSGIASASDNTVKTGGPLKGVSLSGGTFAQDWTDCSSLVAYWTLDETGTNTREATKGTCSSSGDCDLDTAFGSPTNARGIRNNALDGGTGSNNFMYCLDGTCDELDLTSAFTITGWATTVEIFGNAYAVFNGGAAAGGFNLNTVLFLEDDIHFQTYDTSATTVTSSGSQTLGDWLFFSGTWDSGSTTQALNTGSEDNGWDRQTGSPSSVSAGNNNFQVARNFAALSGTSPSNKVDELSYWSVSLSEAESCRLCSCWADGTNCKVSGSTWIDTGYNSTYCGSCTLPSATASCPS